MAITSWGFGPTITAQKWAELFYLAAEGGAGEYVVNLQPSAASGTRKVSLATGKAAIAGVLVESDSETSVTLDNAGSNRWDTVVLDLDWTTSSTSLAVVKGGGVSPALTKDAGTHWQIPLAQVHLTAGVGQLAADDVTDVRPTRRKSQLYRPSIPNKEGSGRTLLVQRDIPYPGFDYRLRMSSQVNFAYRANGYTELSISIDGDKVIATRGGDSNSSPAIIPDWTTGKLTGPVTVRLHMLAVNAGGAGAQSYSSYSNFEIVQEPF